MNLKFHDKRITGILSIIPRNEIKFEDEIDVYGISKEKALRFKKVMGYDRHRIVDVGACVSDLCTYGLEYLLREDVINRDEIDALILVTQTPDHFIPPTSNLIQGRLNLKHDMICLDINQGCAGYIIGLIQAFMLLEQETIKKAVLLNADVLSRKISPKDKNSYPLIGDAASITIVERSHDKGEIFANLRMDGSRGEALMIPAGGLRIPSTQETGKLEDDGNGNFRSKDNLAMDGTAIFNFVQSEVPVLIEELLDFSKVDKENIDYYIFHQPNKFMLQKLADKIGVPYDKMPNNIVENFGNSSSVTIPLCISFNLGDKLKKNIYSICMAGFGSGLSWDSMLLHVGKLDFCKIIEF